MNWGVFKQWEHSDGNLWVDSSNSGISHAWKCTVKRGVDYLRVGGDGKLVFASGKSEVWMMDCAGRVLWVSDVLKEENRTGSCPPRIIGVSWPYRELIVVEIAGMPPIYVCSESGEVRHRQSEKPSWPRPLTGCLRLKDETWLVGRGWEWNVLFRDGSFGPSFNDRRGDVLNCRMYDQNDVTGDGSEFRPEDGVIKTVRTIVRTSRYWITHSSGNEYIDRNTIWYEGVRVMSDDCYSGGTHIPNAFEAMICELEGIIVLLCRDFAGSQVKRCWVEARVVNDLGNLLWRSNDLENLSWLAGSGNVVWYANGFGSKNPIVGVDVRDGRLLHEVKKTSSFTGVIAGDQLIIGGRSGLSAWRV
jgi:hypothetical protein